MSSHYSGAGVDDPEDGETTLSPVMLNPHVPFKDLPMYNLTGRGRGLNASTSKRLKLGNEGNLKDVQLLHEKVINSPFMEYPRARGHRHGSRHAQAVL